MQYIPLISHFQERTQAEGVQVEVAGCGTKLEEVTGWRKLYNEELCG
jgi:hypothetical protein